MGDLNGTEQLAPWERSDEALIDALPAGTELGQFVIEAPIGGGGGGVVYVARHHLLPQRVAIKLMRNDLAVIGSTVTRFMREVEAVRRIRHPNIVNILDFGELTPGRPYYVMELVEGVDLSRFLAVHGRLTPREALELLAPVCDAIGAAHDAGIVHRDIKASNVMVVEARAGARERNDVEAHAGAREQNQGTNGQRTVKLLDFGIAKLLNVESGGPGLTEPGARLGTAGNMAPEQVRGERVDARADIYALGVLLYQLLTGEFPFQAEDPRQVALLHLHAPAPRPSAIAPVSAQLDAVVLTCLEKQPEQRFATAAALLAALRSAVGADGAQFADKSSPAIGIYLEVGLGDEADADDDDLLDDLLGVLDLVEQTLEPHAFVFPLRTSNALLAVRLEAGVGNDEHAQPSALARELAALLEERPYPHPAVHPTLSMRAGEAHYRRSDSGIEITGGPLLELESWTAQHRI